MNKILTVISILLFLIILSCQKEKNFISENTILYKSLKKELTLARDNELSLKIINKINGKPFKIKKMKVHIKNVNKTILIGDTEFIVQANSITSVTDKESKIWIFKDIEKLLDKETEN